MCFRGAGYAARSKGYAAGTGNGYAVRDKGNTVVAECSVMPGYAAHDKSYAAGRGDGYAVRDKNNNCGMRGGTI